MNNIFEKYSSFIFITLLLIAFWIFDFHTIIFLKPQSLHQWRQCDNLSITLNYFQFDLSFLNPKLHAIYGNNGSAIAEFPFFYYLTAQLYYLFGEKESILRLLHLITFSIGLLYLKKTLFLFTKNSLFSTLSPFLFLTSTILIYYSNNFISDSPAFGLTLISWYYFGKHYLDKKNLHLFIALFLITLATLIKTTSLITLGTYGVLVLLSMKKNKIKTIIFLSITPLITLAWMIYASHYNEVNNNIYFLLKIKPIWNSSQDTIYEVWSRISSDWGWKNDMLPPQLLYIVLASPIIILFTKINKTIKLVISSSITLCVLFLLLFYPQLNHHDYYFVHIIPYFLISFIILIWWIGKKNNLQKIAILTMLLYSVYGINYSSKRLKNRYAEKSAYSIYYNLESELSKLGLNFNSKVINLSDNTYCMSLYLMNLQGWTNLNVVNNLNTQYIIDRKQSQLNTKKRISSEIEKRIKLGAKFLIIKIEDDFFDVIPIKYLKNKIFENSDLMIYKIK